MSNECINEVDNYDSLNTDQQNNAPVTPNEFDHMVTSIEEDYNLLFLELQNSKNALEKHKEEYEDEILRLKEELEKSQANCKNSGDVLEKHKKESEQKINELMLKAVEQEFTIREFKNQVETYHKSLENFKNNEKELKKLQQD